MRFVFAIPPANYIYPALVRELKLPDILASYYYFGPTNHHYLVSCFKPGQEKTKPTTGMIDKQPRGKS